MLLGLTIASGAAARGVFSPLQEAIKHDLSVNDLQLSMVQGLAASILSLSCRSRWGA